MPRGDQMSLALNEPKHIALHTNTTSMHAPQVERD